MTDEERSEMSIWSHLDELRKVLFKIGIVVVSAAVVLFIFMPWLFDNIIMAPARPNFPLYRLFDMLQIPGTADGSDIPFSISLINTELSAQLFTHMSLSGYIALVVTFPIVIYLLWTFISPALYENEKRNATTAFLFGNVMFYIGVAVGYFLVFPLTLRFLATYQLSELISNTFTLDSYMDNFTGICLIMGAVFELPLVAWVMGRMGILHRSFFNKYRRHAIVALLILAALITPTGDPFTLLVVFLPLYALWEFSAFIVPKDAPAAED